MRAFFFYVPSTIHSCNIVFLCRVQVKTLCKTMNYLRFADNGETITYSGLQIGTVHGLLVRTKRKIYIQFKMSLFKIFRFVAMLPKEWMQCWSINQAKPRLCDPMKLLLFLLQREEIFTVMITSALTSIRKMKTLFMFRANIRVFQHRTINVLSFTAFTRKPRL